MSNQTQSPDYEKKTYTVKEIAAILGVSLRHAYAVCNTTNDFVVVKVGRLIRVQKESFDQWFGN